jgi:hypothetical protein
VPVPPSASSPPTGGPEATVDEDLHRHRRDARDPPDGDPHSPRTTNSIFTEMTNATPEQIDNDVTLPLQMLYLCETETNVYVDHTFNKAFEININFGTAQQPDYKKLYYSFNVTHDFVVSGTYYDAFKRDVTWEL